MTREKFEEVWKKIFLTLYDEITPHEEVYLKLHSKERIYKEYQKQKSYLKINYMKNPNTHLDRHKIAACMMYAIVKVQPVSIKRTVIVKKYFNKEKFPKKYSILNEYMAFYTALSIVESFRCYENGIEVHRKKNERPGVCQPATTNGEDYIYNTCLDLYLSRKKNKINILTFSNVFFLLETGIFPKPDEKNKITETLKY